MGHATLQCFVVGGTVRWIEVNPRYGGGAALGFAAGCPTPQYMVKSVIGEKLLVELGDYRTGLVMLRYTQDLFLDFDKLAWT